MGSEKLKKMKYLQLNPTQASGAEPEYRNAPAPGRGSTMSQELREQRARQQEIDSKNTYNPAPSPEDQGYKRRGGSKR